MSLQELNLLTKTGYFWIRIPNSYFSSLFGTFFRINSKNNVFLSGIVTKNHESA